MSWVAVGGAAVSVVGGMMSDGGGAAPSVSRVQDFTSNSGLFNTTFSGGNVNTTAATGLQELQAQGVSSANQFAGQVQGDPLAAQFRGAAGGLMGDFQSNPFMAQQQLFDQGNQILAPQQEQARLAQEQRLFSQGRLGSSGALSGSNDQAMLLRAQQEQTQGLFNQSFGQAQMQQAQQGALAGQFAQGALGQQGGLFNLSNMGLQQALSIENAGNQQAQTAGDINRTTTGAVPGQGSPLGDGLMSAGLDMFGTGINGLFQSPTITSSNVPQNTIGARARPLNAASGA